MNLGNAFLGIVRILDGSAIGEENGLYKLCGGGGLIIFLNIR